MTTTLLHTAGARQKWSRLCQLNLREFLTLRVPNYTFCWMQAARSTTKVSIAKPSPF